MRRPRLGHSDPSAGVNAGRFETVPDSTAGGAVKRVRYEVSATARVGNLHNYPWIILLSHRRPPGMDGR